MGAKLFVGICTLIFLLLLLLLLPSCYTIGWQCRKCAYNKSKGFKKVAIREIDSVFQTSHTKEKYKIVDCESFIHPDRDDIMTSITIKSNKAKWYSTIIILDSNSKVCNVTHSFILH